MLITKTTFRLLTIITLVFNSLLSTRLFSLAHINGQAVSSNILASTEKQEVQTPFDQAGYPPPVSTPPSPSTITPEPTLSQTATPEPEITPTTTQTPIPDVEPDVDVTWSINISANPAIYLPEKPITLQWDIRGSSQAQWPEDVQLNISLPKGVNPADPDAATAPDGDGMVRIHDPQAQGALSLAVQAEAEFPLYLSVELVIDGMRLAQNTLQVDRGGTTFEKATGGSADMLGGRVRLVVPADATSEALVFEARPPGPNTLPAVSLTGDPVEVLAVGLETGENVNRFEKPITIQFCYDPEHIFGWNEADLQAFYYDEAGRDWYPLPSTVDLEDHCLSALTDHLTVFDYRAGNWQTYSLPAVETFQVADFTGAATYSFPIWTPPGPAGLSPALSLSYNSQVIDEATAFTQAGWAGMGWSLDTGSIQRNLHGTDNTLNDDTFSISAGGMSGLLLPVSTAGNVTTYNTADQSYIKVQFDSSQNNWKVWDKDGSQYVFDETVSTNPVDGCSSQLSLTWRWLLGSLTDPHGNTLSYEYDVEAKGGPSNCLNQVADYPSTITYPHNRYRVHFMREERNDYQTAWTDGNSRAFFARERLKEIRIEHDVDGDWVTPTIVKKYVLEYADDEAETNVILPNFHFTQGGHTLTLLSIQEMSGDESLALPAMQFSYNDGQHLTGVDNGQGGLTEMEYERWTYFDDINKDLRFQYIDYGFKDDGLSEGQECTIASPTTTWEKLDYDVDYTMLVRCAGVLVGYRLQVGQDGAPYGFGIAHRSMPEHMIKPGGRYLFAVSAKAIQGTTFVKPGFMDGPLDALVAIDVLEYTNIGQSSYQWLEGSLDMPVDYNPTETRLRLECSDCYVNNTQFALYPIYYRVTMRTVHDSVTETDDQTTYQYDNGSPSSRLTSAAVAAVGDQYTHLYTPPLREFRGHALTASTNADELSTLTWFHQSDELKGKAYHSLQLKADPISGEAFDDFETPLAENQGWTTSGSGVTGEQYIYGIDFWDVSVKAENSAANWDVWAQRASASLSDGETAIAHFRLTGSTTQADIGLTSVSGKFFGIRVRPTVNGHEAVLAYDYDPDPENDTGATLIGAGDFQLDRWYVALLTLDEDDGFKARLWQLDAPDTQGEASLGGFGHENWRFRESVNYGLLWLDAYLEGILYSEQETRYSSTTQYDTIANNGITDLAAAGLLTFRDLAVVWNRPIETIQRTYASDAVEGIGDAKWIGTQTTFEYLTGDQNGSQYGNPTRLSYANGNWESDWMTERATKVQYWPRDATGASPSRYLVSLPARQVELACSPTCDFAGESGLLRETLYIYDSNTVYNAQPNDRGRLSKLRTWADVYQGQRRYLQAAYTYDNYGNQASITTYPGYTSAGSNPAGESHTTNYTYDPIYHTYLTGEVNALAQTTSTAYDYALGLAVRAIDANGVSQAAAYDALGRLTAVCAAGDWDGQTCSTAVGATLVIEYSNFDGGASPAVPFHITQRQKLDGSHWLEMVGYLNGRGWLIQTQTLNAQIESGPAHLVTDTHYDPLGRVIEEVRPYSYSGEAGFQDQSTQRPGTSTEYDLLGRVVSVTEPDDSGEFYAYGMVEDGTLGWGSQASLTDANQNTTQNYYDAWGRLGRVSPPAGPGLEYQYDALGQLSGVDYGDAHTSLAYDMAGRKVEMDDADMGAWSYSYDASGNLKTQTDARGCTISMTYDPLNRPTAKTYGGPGACDSTADVSYVYDSYNAFPGYTPASNRPIGRRTGMTDGSGQTIWEYDERGRLALETKTITDIGTYTTTWGYTSSDQVAWTVYPSGEKVTSTYLAQGAPDGLYGDGWDALYVAGSSYDAAGRLVNREFGNAVESTFTFNDWDEQGGRLEQMTSMTGGQNPQTRQDLNYSYDPAGNITGIEDGVALESLSFGYDVLDRLDWVSGAYSDDFAYDAQGRLSLKGGASYTYGDGDHFHAVTLANGNSYSYDSNGNQIQRVVGGVTYTLTYDAEGRLIAISGTGLSAEYSYDGDGNRVKSEITTSSETAITGYVGDYFEVSLGTPIEPEMPSSPNCSVSHCVFFPMVLRGSSVPEGHAWLSYYYAGGQRVAERVQSNQEERESGLYYLVTDHLGSTTVILDAGGEVVSELHYKTWGEARDPVDETTTDYLYTGQRWESEIGLYDYKTRFYDPQLGRFSQADTIVPEPRNVLAWDRFAYANNSPLVYADPDGHSAECGFSGEDHCGVGSGPYEPTPIVQAPEDVMDNVVIVPEIVLSILIEPFDWAVTARDCLYYHNCSVLMFVGLLPMVPASVGRYSDEAAEGLTRLVRLDQVGTSQPFKLRKGEDGLSVFENITPGEILDSFPGQEVPNTTVTIPKDKLPLGTQIIPKLNPDLSQRLSEAHRIIIRPEGWSVDRFAKALKILVGWE